MYIHMYMYVMLAGASTGPTVAGDPPKSSGPQCSRAQEVGAPCSNFISHAARGEQSTRTALTCASPKASTQDGRAIPRAPMAGGPAAPGPGI